MKFTPLLLIFGVIVTAAAIPSFAQVEEAVIPDWLRQNAGWWADRQITDEEFVSGIEYLLSIGVINVETPRELEYKNQIAQLKQEKAQLEADNREIIDQLERVDDYLDSKAISVPQEVWLGNSTGQTPEPVQCGEGTIMKDEICIMPQNFDDVIVAWVTGQLSEQSFLNRMQDVISGKQISGFSCVPASGNSTTVPSWLKNTANSYVQTKDAIMYNETLNGLQYLCMNGLLHN